MLCIRMMKLGNSTDNESQDMDLTQKSAPNTSSGSSNQSQVETRLDKLENNVERGSISNINQHGLKVLHTKFGAFITI